jgi:hypothetical protein
LSNDDPEREGLDRALPVSKLWQCGGAKVTPPDNDRDPVAKTELSMHYESKRCRSLTGGAIYTNPQ